MNSGLYIIRSAVAFLMTFFLYQEKSHITFAPLNPGEYKATCYIKFAPLNPGEYVMGAAPMASFIAAALLIYSPGFKGANFI